MRHLSLHRWIDGAVSSIDTSDDPLSAFGVDPRNLALSSDEFLASALAVARSLADQIHQTGAQMAGDNSRDEHRCCSSMLGKDWEKHAVVHLRDNGNEPPGSPNLGDRTNGDRVEYLDVASAEFLPCSPDQNSCDHGEMSHIQCISSLGQIFYEIFSGGEKAPEMKDKNCEGGTRPFQSDHLGSVSNFTCALSITDESKGRDCSENETSQVIHDDGTEIPDAKRQSAFVIDRSFVSVDSLKSKGLPGPLCDLISNMVNCAMGGDESYCKLSDILDDLQLMIDAPATYLHDIDLEKLSMSGLQLNETIFGRNDDLAALQNSYRRAAFSGESECGFISGMSGTGKSVLAQRLGNYITQSGGLFLQGKFNQRQSAPFSAIAAAFSQYCSMMIDEGETARATSVALQLENVLGHEVHSLAKVIPNLCQFLGLESTEAGEIQSCVDPEKRLRYLMCQFVDVISSFSDAPVTLYIDDVQWADRGSIEIIFQLLLLLGSSNGRNNFYFLACMRQEEDAADDNENEVGDPFCSMLSRARVFGVSVTTVKLACMDESTINTMISGFLCLSPRITRPLSNIIYHKTKGNPFFVSQLIVSLNKEGLLRLSLSRRRWEWDEEKISARQLPNDVVAFLVRTIRRQPKGVQSSLCVLSCFGTRINLAIIQVLETKLNLPLILPLEVAVSEGLLNKTDECYIFSHDKIQEAAYQIMKPEDRCLYHFKYGISLAPHALRCNDDGTFLFVAASQVNMGGPAVPHDVKDGIVIANLNLLAGRRAMEKSDYSSAHSFFDHGISFLRKNHWREHYDLSLQLFDLAAACAVAIGDMESLMMVTQQILKFGLSLEDKLNSFYILVCSLAASSKVQESIAKGVEVLSQLGEGFPVGASEEDLNQQLQEVKAMLCNVTDEQLLNYKAMTDRTKIMVMKFLARLAISMQMIRPVLQHIATLKMIKLSLSHGMSPESSIAFTYYGGLIARLGHVREGYRFVKFAFKTLEQTGSNRVSGQVMVMGTSTLAYVEPLHAAIEFFNEGYGAAMKSGDTYHALLNKLFYTLGLFQTSAANIETVQQSFFDCRRLMKQYNQLTWLAALSIMEISTLTLSGLEDKIDRTIDITRNPRFGKMYHFQNLYVGYMFRRFDQMLPSAEKLLSFEGRDLSLLSSKSLHTFMQGLAAFWIYRTTKDSVWADRARRMKIEMKQWAETSEWNFKGKLHLLEAEDHFSNGDVENAKVSYEKAILTSKAHKFINDEALACELAGHFFFEQDRKDICLTYFLQAHDKYTQWGACAKSNALFQFVEKNVSAPNESALPAESHFASGHSDIIGSRKRAL